MGPPATGILIKPRRSFSHILVLTDENPLWGYSGGRKWEKGKAFGMGPVELHSGQAGFAGCKKDVGTTRNSHKNLPEHLYTVSTLLKLGPLSFYSYFTTAEMTGITKVKTNTMIQHFTQRVRYEIFFALADFETLDSLLLKKEKVQSGRWGKKKKNPQYFKLDTQSF